MEPQIKGGWTWALIARDEPILPGDLFSFSLSDMWTAYRPAPSSRLPWLTLLFWRFTATGMVKRYLGTEPEAGLVVFSCTNPPSLCETERNNIRHAYRVRSVHRSLVSAVLACWRAWRGDAPPLSTAIELP